MMREAIRLGEAALAYRAAILQEFPDEPFSAGWRLRERLGRDGDWRELLKKLEQRRARMDKKQTAD